DNPSGRVFVRDAPPDMGASQGGIQIGDELLAVDGLPVQGMTADDLHKKLVGKVGSKVKLQVRRGGQVVDCVVQRGPLKGGS
ncbi:MAG: PDZ domain-containing protein, partial [Polyangiaceae bacterium]